MIKPHLVYAHRYWEGLVCPGDSVIDATLGNGQDTFFLAGLLKGRGQLVGYDIQQEALNKTQQRLSTLPKNEQEIIFLKHQSHASFDESGVRLIVYNLGYLPGGNKGLTTLAETTLQSVAHALTIVKSGGAISITCYPGHEEGYREQNEIINFLKNIPSSDWNICFHQWLNRPSSPTLIWLQRGT